MNRANNEMHMTPEIHDAANIFPLEEETIPALADDIRRNGLSQPIERLDGKIIDGRRRFKACRLAGVSPTFKDVQVSDPIAYVMSLNFHRRNLDPSQRAMIGARVRELYEREARERQKEHAGTAPGKKKTLVDRGPQVNESGRTRDIVGAKVGVSGQSVDRATKVITHGVPELVKAVDAGEITVRRAAAIAEKPEAVQRAEIETNKSGEPRAKVRDEPAEEPAEIKLQGKGVFLANEALNCLIRIPKNDPLRKRGFQIVTDWIRRNP